MNSLFKIFIICAVNTFHYTHCAFALFQFRMLMFLDFDVPNLLRTNVTYSKECSVVEGIWRYTCHILSSFF